MIGSTGSNAGEDTNDRRMPCKRTLLIVAACTAAIACGDADEGGIPNRSMEAGNAQQWDAPVHRLARRPGNAFREPYKNALKDIDNFGTCPGVEGSRALQQMWSELERLEALASAKGLGPTLARQWQEYQSFLERSLLIQCAGGPEWARSKARVSLRSFAEWVARSPVAGS